MKKIQSYKAGMMVILSVTFFTGCAGQGRGGNRNNILNNRPTRTLPPGAGALNGKSVTLVASNKGSVKHINLKVILPPGTTESLLDYTGPAKITGSISTQSGSLPCLSGQALPFNCSINSSGSRFGGGSAGGNLTSDNCQIGSHSFWLQIILFRSKNLKADFQTIQSPGYSIQGIQIEPVGGGCYFSRGTGVPHPGLGGYPGPVFH